MRILLLTFCLSSIAALAQDTPGKPQIGELVTDRPDFTESSEVVPKGWLQWESGFQFDKSGDTKGYTFGAPLLRFGISKRFELRLSTDGYVGEREVENPMTRGMADAGIGRLWRGFNLAVDPFP